MSAFYADDSGGPPPDPGFMKSQFDYVEYPEILKRARRVDHERLLRYAAQAGVDVDTFIAMVEAQTTGQSQDTRDADG